MTDSLNRRAARSIALVLATNFLIGCGEASEPSGVRLPPTVVAAKDWVMRQLQSDTAPRHSATHEASRSGHRARGF